MNKKIKGSITIEASIIVPLILFVFVVLLHILFYYHDKNILMVTAHETLALGSGYQELKEEELERYFQSRIKHKLMLFQDVESEIQITNHNVIINCEARKHVMRIQFEHMVKRTQPEAYIREIRKVGGGK